MTKPAKLTAFLLSGSLLTGFVTYIAAYAVMVDPIHCALPLQSDRSYEVAEYVGEEAEEVMGLFGPYQHWSEELKRKEQFFQTFFAPVHRLDRRLRPQTWRDPPEPNGTCLMLEPVR